MQPFRIVELVIHKKYKKYIRRDSEVINALSKKIIIAFLARAERWSGMITTSPYFVLTTQQWTRGLGSQFFRETSLPRIL